MPAVFAITCIKKLASKRDPESSRRIKNGE